VVIYRVTRSANRGRLSMRKLDKCDCSATWTRTRTKQFQGLLGCQLPYGGPSSHSVDGHIGRLDCGDYHDTGDADSALRPAMTAVAHPSIRP
jgi:hypothetical protein